MSENPRYAALQALLAVRDGKTLDQALRGFDDSLSERDRGLAKRLANGTLRAMATLDQKAKSYMKRPLPHKALSARLVINMGLYQLADSKSPAYAITSTCLDLLPGQKNQPYRGLIEAILRKVDQDRDTWRETFPQTRSLWLPHWLRSKWENDFGAERLARMLRQASKIPPTDLRFASVQHLRAFQKALAQEQASLVLGDGCGLRLAPGHGPIAALPFYNQGTWWVQDYAAAMPAQILAQAFEATKTTSIEHKFAGRRVLDLCAAPGGKSLQLAAMGADVLAIERSSSRVKRLKANVERCQSKLSGSIEIRVSDALDLNPEDEQFEAILLDAPCSASGTLRRHPEWPYIRTKSLHLENQEAQSSLMHKAARLLKPDIGVLVYAVCSIDPEEGRAISLSPPTGLTLDKLQSMPDGLPEDLLHKGIVRSYPSSRSKAHTPSRTSDTLEEKQDLLDGMDGFFVARFRN